MPVECLIPDDRLQLFLFVLVCFKSGTRTIDTYFDRSSVAFSRLTFCVHRNAQQKV